MVLLSAAWAALAGPPAARCAQPAPKPTLKFVSLQMNVAAKTKEERIAGALRLLEKAADAEGPGVYVLPEYALSPLPDAAGPAAAQEPIPGPATQRFSEVAARRGLWVAVGMAETSPDPKRPYNAIAILGPQGQVYRYHKTHLYEPGVEGNFRETQVYSPGEALDVLDIEGWRMGVMVCFDGNFPEVPRVLALKGAQVILYPNGRNVVLQEAEVAARANNVIVLVANMVGECGLDTGLGTSRIISPVEGESVALEGQQEGWVAKEFRYDDVSRRPRPLGAPFRRVELYGVMTEGAARPPQGQVLAPHDIAAAPGWTADGAAYTAAWDRIMKLFTACQTPWACVGKDCGNWGSTYSPPACRSPQRTLKLVSVQADLGGRTKEERAASALKLLERAAEAEGDAIYVLPELTLCPLPAAAASQEPVPGPLTARFAELANRRGIWIAVGMSETSPDPKRPYNTVVVLGPHDQLFRYRKTHLADPAAGAFRQEAVFTAGDTLGMVDIKGWRVGIVAGGEVNVPEVPRVLSLNGAQVLLECSGRKTAGTESEVASASDVLIVAVANHVGDNGVVQGLGSSRVITPPQGLWAKPVWAPEGQEGWIAKSFSRDDVDRWRNLPVLGRSPTIDPRSRRLDLYGVITRDPGALQADAAAEAR